MYSNAHEAKFPNGGKLCFVKNMATNLMKRSFLMAANYVGFQLNFVKNMATNPEIFTSVNSTNSRLQFPK